MNGNTLKKLLDNIAVQLALAVISLSRGSNFLRDIDFLNIMGWGILALAIIMPMILEKSQLHAGITFLIFALSQATNMMKNAANTEIPIIDIDYWIIWVLVLMTAILLIKKIQIRRKTGKEAIIMNQKQVKISDNKVSIKKDIKAKKTPNKPKAINKGGKK